MNDHPPPARIMIPKPSAHVFAACVLAGFVLFFVYLAVVNLSNQVAWIPSAAWLILVGLVVYAGCQEEGVRGFLVGMLGAFSGAHFAETATGEDARIHIRFGFWTLGRRLFWQSIPVEKIESLEWHTGQGSSMAGRDMNDWNVVLWYNHDDPARSERQRMLRRPDQEILIIGPSGEKNVTAAFGREFLEFLRKAGVPLEQGKDDCTFARKHP